MASIAQRDDQVIRLRAGGASYAAIAHAVGLAGPSNAQRIYRSARARQIPPAFLPRAHPEPPAAFVAWAAGFFDGEGCVSGYETDRGRFRFTVVVAQAVRGPLEELQAAWGGHVRARTPSQAHHKDQWAWEIAGRDAAVFLEDVLPHLRVKFEAARVVIPIFQATHVDRQPLTDDERAARRAVLTTLLALNARGRG